MVNRYDSEWEYCDNSNAHVAEMQTTRSQVIHVKVEDSDERKRLVRGQGMYSFFHFITSTPLIHFIYSNYPFFSQGRLYYILPYLLFFLVPPSILPLFILPSFLLFPFLSNSLSLAPSYPSLIPPYLDVFKEQ